MSLPAARIGDSVACTCGCPPGVVITGHYRTIIENQVAARVGDLCSNCCGGNCPCPNAIISGSPKTIIGNKPAAHLTSQVVCGVITGGAKKTIL